MIISASSTECGNYDIRLWLRHGSSKTLTQRARRLLGILGKLLYNLLHGLILVAAVLYVFKNLVSLDDENIVKAYLQARSRAA